MDDNTIKRLIKKYLDGTCTPEEEAQLSAWYDSLEEGDDYLSTLTDDEIHRLEHELLDGIQQQKTKQLHTRPRLQRFWLVSSAAALMAVLSLVFYWNRKPDTVNVATSFGETRDVLLPDQSEVKLNGNSSLSYLVNMDQRREVWFEGEGSFRIQKLTGLRNFIIHLSDTLSVEVIGTAFNISKRPSVTQIALRNGRIRVHHNRANQSKTMDMEPNEILLLKDSGLTVNRFVADDIDSYFAWEHKKLVLDDTSLKELCQYIVDTYGITVEITDEQLEARTASGSIPIEADNETMLLYICALYDLNLAPSAAAGHFRLIGK